MKIINKIITAIIVVFIGIKILDIVDFEFRKKERGNNNILNWVLHPYLSIKSLDNKQESKE